MSSEDDDDAHHNQSVDSDGKAGGKRATSRSHRHNNFSEMQLHKLASANQGQTQAGTNVESDMESEKSGPVPYQLTMYQSCNNNNTSLNVLASDSETDGNFSDTGSYLGTIVNNAQAAHNNDGIDGISEHSSDDDDSDDDEPVKPGEKKMKTEKLNADGTVKPKKKKNKEEKQGGKSKKNKEEKSTAGKEHKKEPKDKNAALAKTHKNFKEDKQGTGKDSGK